ncbi:MAG: sigma-70 family RNA polymerase sigma factor [Flavobacteriaceae bacterium]|nr:sigma-70 family RNA polymerase sigma factor [Bacteroidia bacterium]MBT8287754.1 sigma-70 family RNA polymerase sigma factor [Bacteroidia bacterium]NNF74636.1 sigma-70 family RNA polymerase sigma factor [Flavobacteriaceae bacterium]
MRKKSDILDGLLVIDFRNGNKKAMALLVKRWHSKFCRQAFWYTQNMDDAKDIVQDCWQLIFRKINQLDDPNAFKSWAMRIVVRKAIDWTRKQKRRPISISNFKQKEQEQIEEGGSREDLLRRLNEAIKNLPENQGAVLHLFYIQEYNLKEIAEILDISKGTVKSRLYYAREHLKQLLK